MPTPFLRRFFPAPSAEGTMERLIDNEYQLERVASGDTNDATFSEYLRFLYDAQKTAAAAAIKTAAGKSKTDALPNLSAILSAPDSISSSPFVPVDTVQQSLDAQWKRLRERSDAIETVVAAQIENGTENDLLAEAIRALKNGMASTGRDQQEEFRDALRLFREAQEGGIGNRNYVIWFHIGWLLWKEGKELAAAEEAFYQAYRLSASANDVFYYLSQRHRAYLQFLQGKADEARDTMTRAISLYGDDPDTVHDAALYASAAGHADEAADFVRRLVALEPAQSVTVWADPAFASAIPTLAEKIYPVFESAARKATDSVRKLTKAKANIQIASERAGVELTIPDELMAGTTAAEELLKKQGGTLSYPMLAGIAQSAVAQTNALYNFVEKVLEETNEAIEQRLIRPTRQIERLRSEQKKWKEDVAKLERSARQMNYNLASAPRRNLFGRMNVEHATLYENYQTARGQAEINAQAIKKEVPGHEAEIARGREEQARIAETIAWLEAEQGQSNPA